MRSLPEAGPDAPGEAIAEATALQAAEWFYLLQSREASEADRRRWARWCEAHPSHALAWARARDVGQALAQLPPAVALPVLGRPARTRRRAVQSLAALLMAAPAGWLAWRQTPARDWLADQRTATGERRAVALDDGTRLLLDTASAVDIAFDGRERLIHLRAGAIHITTAADPEQPPRPLAVATAQGRLLALGTRFTVRQEADHVRVAVFEGAVRATPVDGAGNARVLQAGEQARVDAVQVDRPEAIAPQADSWTRGVLHVRGMRLGDFVAELDRYRPGLLRCDPRVAGLQVSGVFQLRDTTAIIDSLPHMLPVSVVYRSRYWVVVAPPGA
jgi:transmembrane sensor